MALDCWNDGVELIAVHSIDANHGVLLQGINVAADRVGILAGTIIVVRVVADPVAIAGRNGTGRWRRSN